MQQCILADLFLASLNVRLSQSSTVLNGRPQAASVDV